mmetsp:Transcript_14986/g.41461  ORF Transcript_14986/g.41461 Transcript_14986/m.41461 type:complete len:193 (-) Transcript_14986:62-640(-)
MLSHAASCETSSSSHCGAMLATAAVAPENCVSLSNELRLVRPGAASVAPLAARRLHPLLPWHLLLVLLLAGCPHLRCQEDEDPDDHPETAEVEYLNFKKITDAAVTIQVRLTDLPRWSQEQPFFLTPQDIPTMIHVPLRFRMDKLRRGEYCDVHFEGLLPDTTYAVKLNWSLKAPNFPNGWTFRTLPMGGDL